MSTEIILVAKPPPNSQSHVDQILEEVQSLTPSDRQALLAKLLPSLLNLGGNNAVNSTVVFQLNGGNASELITTIIDAVGKDAVAAVLDAIASRIRSNNDN